MIKKIKGSLSLKVFIWIASVLTVCSFLIYGIVILMFPQGYSMVTEEIRTDRIEELREKLNDADSGEKEEILKNFTRNNYAAVIWEHDGQNKLFGMENMSEIKRLTPFSYGIEIESGSGGAEMVTVILSVSEIKQIMAAFIKLFPFICPVILLVAAGGAFICSRVIVKPVIEISRISSRMAKLDMTWECHTERSDEIGILAESLNSMKDSLEETMGALKEANGKLKEEMANIQALSCRQRDFFTAASHELKTPVTILKGQIESMTLGIGRFKDTKKCLPETLEEVENMQQLIMEILTVSKMELGSGAGDIMDVSFNAAAAEAIRSLKPLADKKHMRIAITYSSDFIVQGSPVWLKKAIHNIINNAVVYSPYGAEVFINIGSREISVQNTGVFIPQEDIPFLFTPFYRVEKSRNKKNGGSGLGLYIVKTILDRYGLKYSIKNNEAGVCFLIQQKD